MAEPTENFPVVREGVASFADRGHFQAAVGELLAAGFESSVTWFPVARSNGPTSSSSAGRMFRVVSTLISAAEAHPPIRLRPSTMPSPIPRPAVPLIDIASSPLCRAPRRLDRFSH